MGLALAALATTDLKKVRPAVLRHVEASGRDGAELVVAFLTELLLLAETERFVPRSIRAVVTGTGPMRVSAELKGEPLDPARHGAGTEVKAVTYHALLFDPRHGRARVIVDL